MIVKRENDALDHDLRKIAIEGTVDVTLRSVNTLMYFIIVRKEMIEETENISAIERIVVTVTETVIVTV